MTKRLTTEEFIERARKVHGDLYDYGNTNYIDAYTPIEIHCNRCGQNFIQRPHDHLSGYGCTSCGRKARDDKKRWSLNKFLEKAKEVHGDKYDYSEVNYTSYNTKVKIYCKDCKKYFYQTPHVHLCGHGCPHCSEKRRHISKTFTNEKYIKLAKKAHGDKYDYSKTVYKGMHKKVEIYCNTCKEYFWQSAGVHLNKNHGCPKCAIRETVKKNTKPFEDFLERAKVIHRNDYDYSKANYVNVGTKIEITCNKCHKSFHQTPHSHLRGNGCPYCKQSRGEKAIRYFLNDNKITFEIQKRFKDCKDNKPLPFDFYLPDYNLCIEYQGEQHYRLYYHKNMNKNEGEKQFKKLQLHDKIKKEYCKNNNIHLLEIRYDEDIESKLKGKLDELR